MTCNTHNTKSAPVQAPSAIDVQIATAGMTLNDQASYAAMHVRDLSDSITAAVSKSGPVKGLLSVSDKVVRLPRLSALYEVFCSFSEKLSKIKKGNSAQSSFEEIKLEAVIQLIAASNRIGNLETCENVEKARGTVEGLKKVIQIMNQPT